LTTQSEYNRRWRAKHLEAQRKYQRDYTRRWRANHPESKERTREYMRDWHGKHCSRENLQRKALTEFTTQQKIGKRCALCGESDAVKLVFHHRDPATKSFGISNVGGRTREAILEEMKKCVLWCKACHTAYHHKGGETT